MTYALAYVIFFCIFAYFLCAHMTKLSIITINRNNVVGLRKTMESVFSQIYRDFEYIVVDGASDDGSVEVVKEFEQKMNPSLQGGDGVGFFTWISEPDTGIYNAMNKGIKKAAGVYCLFLNSGDFLITPDVLERVFAQQIDADIINARCNVSDNGKVTWTSPYLPQVSLKDLYFVGLPHQSTFIRRSLFEKYGLYREDFRYNSDIDFWYKSIILGDATTQGVDVVTTDYNLDGQSSKDALTDVYKKEMKEILSQGFLPKVLLDYDLLREQQHILNKYIWIEKHPMLQRVLALIRKTYKRI